MEPPNLTRGDYEFIFRTIYDGDTYDYIDKTIVLTDQEVVDSSGGDGGGMSETVKIVLITLGWVAALFIFLPITGFVIYKANK